MSPRPEYLLFTEALRHSSGRYLWRFLLVEVGSDRTITASDLADADSGSRTELLALVRGLEAVDRPAAVRLFTASSYVNRGLARGLTQWRNQKWHWERFGRRVPIRDCDLWQRVDRALDFHTIDCHAWGEPEHATAPVAYEPTEEFAGDPAWAESPATDTYEPAVLVAARRPAASRRGRVGSATRRTLGNLRRRVETMLDPALLPAG